MLADHFSHLVITINERLSDTFAAQSSDIAPLDEAIRYALLAGGKRLRPALTLACAEMLGANREDALPVAIAIECMHTYSLIHDDLPDMDDDELRRGKPTTHVQFDPATAILAGDALQTEAFTLIASADQLSAEQRNRAISCLAAAAGRRGMVGGQQMDINQIVSTQAELQHMHQLKTGALISAACELGAICGNAEPMIQTTLREFGLSLGLLFQIKDDLLDEENCSTTLGKTAGKDRLAGKVTYVSLLGIDGATEALTSLITHTKSLLKPLDCRYNTELLQWLVDRAATRHS